MYDNIVKKTASCFNVLYRATLSIPEGPVLSTGTNIVVDPKRRLVLLPVVICYYLLLEQV